jgi:PEP-CTERM motif
LAVPEPSSALLGMLAISGWNLLVTRRRSPGRRR